MSFEFKYIIPTRPFWLEHFPEPMWVFVAGAYEGFIPPDTGLKTLSSLPSHLSDDAQTLRHIAHGMESFEGDASLLAIREQELAQATEHAFQLNDQWDGMCEAINERGEKVRFSVDRQGAPREWFWGNRLLEFFARRQSSELGVKLTLRSGRVADEMVILAAAALVQVDRAAEAFYANKIEAFAYLISDAQNIIKVITERLVGETKSRQATRNAFKSHAGRVKSQAMMQVRHEFERWLDGQVVYRNDSDFARKMLARHPDVLTNETSIKNNCTKWRRERGSLS